MKPEGAFEEEAQERSCSIDVEGPFVRSMEDLTPVRRTFDRRRS
jgi:hypothetical protein